MERELISNYGQRCEQFRRYSVEYYRVLKTGPWCFHLPTCGHRAAPPNRKWLFIEPLKWRRDAGRPWSRGAISDRILMGDFGLLFRSWRDKSVAHKSTPRGMRVPRRRGVNNVIFTFGFPCMLLIINLATHCFRVSLSWKQKKTQKKIG